MKLEIEVSQKQSLESFNKDKSLTKFIEIHLIQSLLFHQVAALRSATLLRKRFWHKCFPVNFAKFLRTPVLQGTSGQLCLASEQACRSSGLNSCKILMKV